MKRFPSKPAPEEPKPIEPPPQPPISVSMDLPEMREAASALITMAEQHSLAAKNFEAIAEQMKQAGAKRIRVKIIDRDSRGNINEFLITRE